MNSSFATGFDDASMHMVEFEFHFLMTMGGVKVGDIYKTMVEESRLYNQAFPCVDYIDRIVPIAES